MFARVFSVWTFVHLSDEIILRNETILSNDLCGGKMYVGVKDLTRRRRRGPG